MLKNLRLKNWRSLRDVSIDFHPEITVLIGANSSGKTNIIDALHFIRDSHLEGTLQAVLSRGGGDKIRTIGTDIDTSATIEYTSQLREYEPITYTDELLFTNNRFKFNSRRTLTSDSSSNHHLLEFPLTESPNDEGFIPKLLLDYVVRWQLLDENFMPPLAITSTTIGDVLVIDPCADNLIFMLDFMQNTNPELYEELQDDFRYLLGHVKKVEAVRDEREARIRINETSHPDREAPTISAGTARILAVLTAVYALDMRLPDMPGLVVVEEPETSLNPSLLRNFVEMLRGYAKDKKRQFILTTHNPAFLNHFKPEEVRVVSRDENGDSVVNPIPDYINDIWLKNGDSDYQLGDVWLTNAFGGIVE